MFGAPHSSHVFSFALKSSLGFAEATPACGIPEPQPPVMLHGKADMAESFEHALMYGLLPRLMLVNAVSCADTAVLVLRVRAPLGAGELHAAL